MGSDSTYQNPLGIKHIGDPFILRASDGRYYCYPTCSGSGYRVWVSDDLVIWTDRGYVFNKSDKAWAKGKFWAPEVVEYDGGYFMFYTAALRMETGGQRIGLAVSDSPLGPFVDIDKNRPFYDPGYCVIDANVLIDDDRRTYLYFSRDVSANVIAGRHESNIYGVELSDDLTELKHDPVLLLRPDQPWEERSGPDWVWLEGSFLLKHENIYYLMYSANFYASRNYAVGYAKSERPLGPFEKFEHNPIMSSAGESISGSGHNCVTVSPDRTEFLIAYHTHTNPGKGGGNRQLNIDRMGFRSNGDMYVNGPTKSVQPLPSGSRGVRNIAGEAILTVSSEKAGFPKTGLTDGILGFSPLTIRDDWCSDNQSIGAWVSLDWDSPRRISAIFLYNSYAHTRKILAVRIEIADSLVIEEVEFGNDPEVPGYIELHNVEVTRVTITVTASVFSEAPVGLSQIVVIER